ncbi:MAG: phosphoribosyltransferase family protein [Candidatus Caldarchaeum sp.]|nr:phosphoribosyltransferase family protein [Candidatus Caldarchaeum sp.]
MAESAHLQTLSNLLEGLRTGKSVRVIPAGGRRILRISWLNVVHDPQIFQAIAKLIKTHVTAMGYQADAVASIETSGAKYGLATSYELGVPYFSIHKTAKIIFEQPITAEGISITENKPTSLYIDKSVASKFGKVILIDDVRRTSTTINTAVELLRECGTTVTACYVIIDLAFAGYPRPNNIPSNLYHPLFVISSVDESGRCVVDEGLVWSFLSEGFSSSHSHQQNG